ncbi:prephenate dehydrogenase [Nocardioides sp. cx-173]|uniref:prephenate dehydrogenase n=1 Tax=Nocardioides sp. cx-173 TaxID=2898796 RepID=UPI001E5CD2B6|nr:prephenate dehydrogenase [Nocardioides sp. cx-173]MCD4527404.1 prephenate dehydrogenase [Nocardioides sp. cx-173]UGB43854.1 prephenate dehydrogenase [Nocardioides sp. cx-173]
MSDTLVGPVEIVGAGLIGTSIALACRRAGLEVLLTDPSDDHLRTASGLGAGRASAPGDRPQLVVVAVPPDHLAQEIGRALAGDAVVTDVGSVKAAPLAALAGVPGIARYVGGHPMAGSERSGPLAASAALFDGRPWAVTPHPESDPAAVGLVEELAALCGAVPVRLTPEEHDKAVARTSHVPHLMASLAAGALAGAPAGHLALSGQGVRDVTRVAAGDPALYGQIVAANAAAVGALLTGVRARLDAVIEALAAGDRAGVERVLGEGVRGTRAIPGKHGGTPRPTGAVFVAVPDHPGELARLFADAGESGVNIEDVRIDHDPGRPVGLVELIVDEDRAEHLLDSLESRGWVTHR